MFRKTPKGWDGVSTWYGGMVGENGSLFHQKFAVPAILEMANIAEGEYVLDIGCGTGFLSKYIWEIGANYTGVDASRNLLSQAEDKFSRYGEFIYMDSANMQLDEKYDVGLFLLSIADMNPLDKIAKSTASNIRTGGSVVILMLHPGFRIQRQSGWQEDNTRRIDAYMSNLSIPLKQQSGGGVTISFHRPIGEYINTFTGFGFMLDDIDEIVNPEESPEIPLFLAMRFVRI